MNESQQHLLRYDKAVTYLRWIFIKSLSDHNITYHTNREDNMSGFDSYYESILYNTDDNTMHHTLMVNQHIKDHFLHTDAPLYCTHDHKHGGDIFYLCQHNRNRHSYSKDDHFLASWRQVYSPNDSTLSYLLQFSFNDVSLVLNKMRSNS